MNIPRRLERRLRRLEFFSGHLLAVLLLGGGVVQGATWKPSQKIPLGATVVRVLPDPHRPWVYAIDRTDSNILFVDLGTRSVQNSLYVGKDPTDLDIDASGNFLYVANKGPGTGLYGSWRIGVIALTNQTLVNDYITLTVAENVRAGRPGRLYYNSGYDLWNGGDAHSVNTDTGADLGSFAGVKTHMVILSDRTRLFGQYIYEGNLGAMAAFDVASDQIVLRDSAYYSPYPYGWDYDNYSLSADDRYLAYGQILFNPTNFSQQIGKFPEQVYALNRDGTVAFGQASIWDTTTFALHGDANKIGDMPFATTVMAFDGPSGFLYAFNAADNNLYAFEQTTTRGIPFRWLSYYGLPTDDTVEGQDADKDGYTVFQEWLLDSNPTNFTPALILQWASDSVLTLPATSGLRLYDLQRTTNPTLPTSWQSVAQHQGTGTNLVFDVSVDRTRFSGPAFYRVQPKLPN